MTTWIKDDRGNKCSVEYFGTKEAAQKALDSLENCDNCINCSDCSDCSRCSDCSDCSDCSRCSHVACLIDKKDIRANPNAREVPLGPPPTPIISNIHQAVFDAASNPRALNMTDWHTCEKTHCRAGWVVTLAGEQGKALESFFNTELAAMKIYAASSPLPVSPARFYDDNEDAVADMKRMADAEASNAA